MATRDAAYYRALCYPYELTKEEDGFFATHPDLPGCMAEGDTADEAVHNLDASREAWIETRIANGYDVPEPLGDDFSGRVSLRMTPSLHGRLAKIAQRQSMSLNSLLNYALTSFAGASEPIQVTTAFSADIRRLSDEIGSMKSAVLSLTGGGLEAPRGTTAGASRFRRKSA